MNTICYEPAPTILVADHDDDHRCLVRAVLALKGFEVLEALDGEAAVALAVAKKPALLLIDLRLAGQSKLSGIRVIRRLRESGLREMPIIATSVSEPTSHCKLALAAGCVAHIEKPFEPDQLDDLLDQFLPGTRASLISILVH